MLFSKLSLTCWESENVLAVRCSGTGRPRLHLVEQRLHKMPGWMNDSVHGRQVSIRFFCVCPWLNHSVT